MVKGGGGFSCRNQEEIQWIIDNYFGVHIFRCVHTHRGITCLTGNILHLVTSLVEDKPFLQGPLFVG